METAAKKKSSLALGVIASMIAWVSTCLLSSAAIASSATPTLTTNAPTATHVALKTRAEIFLGVSLKSVERSELSPVNATRYYDALEGVALECTVAPSRGARVIPGQPGVVTGGSSTTLGKNMMESMGLARSQRWTDYQAQHIIPSEMASHPVLQKIGMNLDDASNGIFLRVPDEGISAMSRHRGYHSTYNEVVERALGRMDVNRSVSELQQEVFNLQQRLKHLQQQGTPLYPSQGATVDLWERLLGQ